MLCAFCKTSAPTGTNCGFCKNQYCFACSKITEVEYGNLKPYQIAAWKCLSCRGEYAQASALALSSLAVSGPAVGADNLLEVMRKLNDISTKLDCIPKLVADVESLRSELRELKDSVSCSKASHTKHEGAQNVNKATEHHKKKQPPACREPPAPIQPTAPPAELFTFAPMSSFDLSEFKRVYSKEDAYHSISYFWHNFDAENWSIWYSEYKYPQELTKVFMSCNLITGMFQRLDKLRPHVFASVCVFGEDNNSSISGVWVWRGHQLIFTLSDQWQEDYEYYSWRRLEPRGQEAGRLLQDYLAHAGFDSRRRKFNQARVFK